MNHPKKVERLFLKWPPRHLPKKSNPINTVRHNKVLARPVIKPIQQVSVLREKQKCDFEIFAYCSKNYKDAYDFVINSWTNIPTMKLVTLYTDWEFKPNNDKVIVKPMFEESSDWITGTGRRLNVIRDFSNRNKGTNKNILFMDIDCYIVRDPSEIFTFSFDIGITRLYSGSKYTNQTATAGLWFCKLSDGYYNFINDWFATAEEYKKNNIGVTNHKISYVQYSFTDVARKQTTNYKILPLDEKIYNSEHSDLKKWYSMITQYKPKILHFKGRRFRDKSIVETSLNLAQVVL